MEEKIVRDEALVKIAEEMMEKQEFGERRLSGIPFKITFLIAIAFPVSKFTPPISAC